MRLKSQKLVAGVAGVALFAGLGACGSDDSDDDASSDTTEAPDDNGALAGDSAAFCDGLVEFNSAVFNVELDETSTEEDVMAAGDDLVPIFEPVVENAPDDLADLATQLDTALQPLLEGDAEAFNADETFGSYMELVSGATDACDYDGVDVTAVDYAYEDVPETIAAGNVSFTLSNESDAEDHEMAILRRNDGVSESFDEILQLPEDQADAMIEFKTAAFASPGEQGSTLATLDPGDYVMVCFLPVGGAEDGPPHVSEGMVKEFTVE
jgi:hypothetical protein